MEHQWTCSAFQHLVLMHWTERAQTDRQTDRQADRQADRQVDRQADRQADRQVDRQADRQTDRKTLTRADSMLWNSSRASRTAVDLPSCVRDTPSMTDDSSPSVHSIPHTGRSLVWNRWMDTYNSSKTDKLVSLNLGPAGHFWRGQCGSKPFQNKSTYKLLFNTKPY